jgi:hypothetical protein
MKRKIIFLEALLLSALMGACLEPEEKRDDMNMNPVTISESDFSVTQNPSSENEVILESYLNDAIPFWNYGMGISYKVKDTVIIPFAGNYWIKYYAYTKSGPAVDSVNVIIENNDPVYFSDPSWELISNTTNGKKWVMPDNPPGGWIWGCAGMDSPYPVWWGMTKAETLAEPTLEAGDTVYFDLNGGFNIRILHSDGSVNSGIWSWSPASGKLTMNGVSMPLSARAGVEPSYQVMKLTGDELCLWSGWACFVFVRAGYSYP